MSLFYRAVGVNAWYESAIVLYEGMPAATATPTTPTPATLVDHTIAAVHVVRGEIIADFKTESFTIQKDGHYFVAFYSGSYDRNGEGGDIQASVTIDKVSVSTPPYE